MKRKRNLDDEYDGEVASKNVDEEEIGLRDMFLEQGLFKKARRETTAGEHSDSLKIIKLEGTVPQLTLPSGWIALRHKSGGIIYLHRQTRVCTWAWPYHIGPASVRKHQVPTLAIPCFHQFIALEKNKKRQVSDNQDGDITPHDGMYEVEPGDHVDHLSNHDNQTISAADLAETSVDNYGSSCDGNHGNNHSDVSCSYNKCKITCNEKDIQDTDSDSNQVSNKGHCSYRNNDADSYVKPDTAECSTEDGESQCSETSLRSNPKFDEMRAPSPLLDVLSVEEISDYLGKLWEFREITKVEDNKCIFTDSAVPSQEPEDYKSAEILKTLPYLVQGPNPESKSNENVVINPAGKSPRSLLYEYCLKVLKVKPVYSTKESGIANSSFISTVEVDGLRYGSGIASSKKQAMHLAAQQTLEIFMPETFKKLLNIDENLKIFDAIPIEDPNIFELTTKLGLLSPYQVLNECQRRNQGVLTSELKFYLHHGADKQLYYTLECGQHLVTGTCTSKKYGRELASQAMLQRLHPHLKFWGSVLRIYVDQHTSQGFARPLSPAPTETSSSVNKELLSDLKREMWKLWKKKEENEPTKIVSKSFTDIDL